MGFFDYKFMILLGLTFVIYFIYREIELLHSRINQLEDQIKSVDIKLLTNEVNNSLNKTESPLVKQVEPVKPTVKQVEPVKQLVSVATIPKIINIELNNSLEIPKSKDSGIKISAILPKNKKLPEIASESELTTTDCSTSSTSKHLAIYSNDNEQFVETQNSLLESVEAHKNDLDFDYGKMEGLNENVNDLIDLINSEENNSNNSEENNSNNSEENNSNKFNENNSNKSDEKNDLDIDDIIAEKDRQLSEMSSTSNKNNTEKKYDANTLDKTKISDLKKIAKELNISLSKKQNNHTIVKTKPELIQEILNSESK